MADKTNVPNIPLIINKGETFEYTYTLYHGVLKKGEIVAGDPVDLTGATAVMQIRPTATDSTLILELTTENGRITIDPLVGKINLTIADTDTEAITQVEEVYYGLETLQSGVRKRRFEGSVYLTEDPVR